MVSHNGISLAFVLISVTILLLVTPTKVNAECSCDNQNATETGGISGFLHKVGCGFKIGAKKVTDKVKDGYEYVKTKLADENTEPKQPDVDLRFDDSQPPPVVPLATVPPPQRR